MFDPDKITKCAADSPNRCTSMTAMGQCLNESVILSEAESPEGVVTYTYGTKCKMHGGTQERKSLANAGLKNYRLTKFRSQIERLGSSDGVKSLRDEIGILRVMMEERLNQCNDAADLLLQSHIISDLAMKIEKMVYSCTRLESTLGQTMDKQAILNFASQVIGIIGEHVQDPDTLDLISSAILSSLSEQS